MIELHTIRNFFPPAMQDIPEFQQYMLKEYILIIILDYLNALHFFYRGKIHALQFRTMCRRS